MPTDLFLEKDMLINVKMKTSEIIKKTYWTLNAPSILMEINNDFVFVFV